MPFFSRSRLRKHGALILALTGLASMPVVAFAVGLSAGSNATVGTNAVGGSAAGATVGTTGTVNNAGTAASLGAASPSAGVTANEQDETTTAHKRRHRGTAHTATGVNGSADVDTSSETGGVMGTTAGGTAGASGGAMVR